MKSYNDNNIINYEVMGGWPICKMNIRDILKGFGATFNKETKKWEIPESSKLDIFPKKLNDDGMGYGVNEEYIISVDLQDSNYCNIFTEKELNNIDIWKRNNVFPGMSITVNNIEYYIYSLEKINDEFIFICKDEKNKNKMINISENNLKNYLLI